MRKMVLLRWSVGAVGAGSVPGGAFGGACFGALHLGEGRVPNRDYAGRGKAPVAEKSGVGVGRRLVGRRRAERRRAWRRSVNAWLQSRSLPARGRAGLEVYRSLCIIIDSGNFFISTVLGQRLVGDISKDA